MATIMYPCNKMQNYTTKKQQLKKSICFSRVPSGNNSGTSTEIAGGDLDRSTMISATVRESNGTTVSVTKNFNSIFINVCSGER